MTAVLALTLFHEIAYLLLAAACAGAAALRLRQPLVTVFIAVGVAAGPSGFGLVGSSEELELLATIGIALLLFVVGLKLDVRLLRTIGPGVLAAGAFELATMTAAGVGLGLLFGLDPLPALYLGLGLALSSTVVVVKLLSDRDELDQLHGRLAVGILILQDLVVIAAMIVFTDLGGERGVLTEAAAAVGKSALFLGLVVVAARWLLPPLLHRLASSQELLVLFAIAWALALAATADLLELSKEVGAFLAGVSLAASAYREAIGGRLTSVRDFLLLFFFVNLGTALDVGSLDRRLLVLAALCSAAVLALKPVLTIVPLAVAGYRARPSLRAGIALAQVSEFSLILASVGLALDHLGRDVATLLSVVAIVTITASTYVVGVSPRLVDRLAPRLERLTRTASWGHDEEGHRVQPEVIVVGLGRYGIGIVEGAEAVGHHVLGVDLDPQRLSTLSDRGLDVVYGDAEDPDLPSRLPLASAGWVISTLRRPAADLALVRALRAHGYRGRIAVSAHFRDDVRVLSEAGADRVLTPFRDAATAATAAMFGTGEAAQPEADAEAGRR